MKSQDSSIRERSQLTTHHYAEIIELLETGSRKIVKSLRNSRQARPSHKVKIVRKQLGSALKSSQEAQGLKRIRILVVAIQNVVHQLDLTRKDFHSKGLRQTREYASSILTEVKIKYQKAIKGGMPMGK
jgi:hypothetical protein